MLVTTAKIKALKPCKDRLDNFVKHHGEFRGTMTKFLSLKEITHADKCWVYFRMISKSKVALVAADIAETVLHLYETKCPRDNRPRAAIEAARKWGKDAAYASNAAYDAYAAAYASNAAYDAYAAAYASNAAYDAYAATSAAYAAAYAAATAAATAAYVTYAPDAPNYAAAAARATSAASKGRAANEALQIKIMKKYLKKGV